MKEMREYVVSIVRAKRSAVLHNRRLVSRGYIRKILVKRLLLDKCYNSYTTMKLLSVDEANDLITLVRNVLKEYGITSDLLLKSPKPLLVRNLLFPYSDFFTLDLNDTS